VNDEKLRAWWWHRQGLDGTLAKASASDVLARQRYRYAAWRPNPLAKFRLSQESYVRTDLLDARSFSLDSPKSRAPRVEALRKAGRRAP
jgi:hypothetical protein